MKLFCSLLFILFLNAISVAQFVEINVPYNNYNHNLNFLNADTGMLLGSRGNVYRTENGGATWDSISSGYSSWLNDIYFIDDQLGFIGGGAYFTTFNYPGNLILKTSDGGLSFDSINVNLTSGEIIHIDFGDENFGIFTGSYRTFVTYDSGLSLDTLYFGDSMTAIYNGPKNVAIPSNNHVYISLANHLGGGMYEWRVLKSTDMALTWDTLYADLSVQNYQTHAMSFPSNNVGYITGEKGEMIRTYNGGNSWDEIIIDTSMILQDVQFVNDQVGYVSAIENGTNSGYVFATINGGDNWTSMFIDTSLSTVQLSVTNNILYVSSYQKFYKTTIDSFVVNGLKKSEDVAINVYPNPASEKVIISLEDERLNNLAYQIFDVTGKMIQQGKLETSIASISIATLPTGMYALRISSEGKAIAREKLLIE